MTPPLRTIYTKFLLEHVEGVRLKKKRKKKVYVTPLSHYTPEASFSKKKVYVQKHIKTQWRNLSRLL